MKFKNVIATVSVAAMAVSLLWGGQALAKGEQFFPSLVYRTGPFAPNGIPVANGFADYYQLVNARDGGINGVKVTWEECETKYNTKLGVECYEKLKNKGETGATVVNPFSTGITYQLIPKASVDQVPILSMGYGQTAASDGRVFEWVFTLPATYWSQASAFIRYIGKQEGGLDKLKGKKIALVHLNIAYGKEPIPTLELLSIKYGFELQLYPVEWPGQEQKATWLQIRRSKPDWILQWNWGVSNSVAVKEAAGIKFPMDHFIGVWWSAAEPDVLPAGDGAIGYKGGNMHAVGDNFQIHKDILKYVYKGDKAAAKANNFGEVLYNRGLVNAMFGIEAVRTAQMKYGKKPMKGAQVRWGFENLNITNKDLKRLGMEGMARPLKITCSDHESTSEIAIQQWDGKEWKVLEWVEPMRDIVRPMIEKAAADYAKENKITPRKC